MRVFSIPTQVSRMLRLVLATFAVLFLARQGRAEGARPNFVFFITDDISAEDIGPYGNGQIQTPNLDRLAEEALVFEKAYLVISSCSPSRCSILTGRYPHNHGAPELHMELPSAQSSFMRRLREAGYYTAISGKNHMGNPTELGFSRSFQGGGPGASDDWIQILKDRPRDKPFFVWFASHDAHRGWQLDSSSPRYDANTLKVPPYLIDGPQTRKDLADYYHEVSRSDAQVGLLLAELERQQISQNTYFIYCSDNGRPFPRCKTRLYDSGIRTPLIIRRPGHVAHARTHSLVSSIDLAPTFLELAGAPALSSAQGVSFVPVLKNPESVVRDYAFSEHNWHVFAAHERAVRFGKWLFIRNAWPSRRALCMESTDAYPAGKELWEAHAKAKTNPDQRDIFLQPRPEEEFYDTESDPHQLRNLILSGAHAIQIREARDILDRWTRETGDTVPKNPTPDREGERRGRQQRGELPGEAAGAASLAGKGPVLRGE